MKCFTLFNRLKDCPPNSLKQLDMNGLLKRSQISGTCMFEARKTFKRKYVNTMFRLHGPFKKYVKLIEDDSKSIDINNFMMIKFLLIHFGDLIHRLSITFNGIDVALGREIVTLINHKSTEFLEVLELISCKGNILDSIKIPFKNMFSFCFSSDPIERLEITAESRQLNQFAPDLYSLKLEDMKESDWAFFNGTCPQLRKLTVSLRKSTDENKVDTQHVIRFLQENPTIGVIAIANCSLTLLKEINDILPQLEKMYISNLSEDYMNYDGEAIHFKNVQYVSIDSDYDEVPAGIVFSHLDKISLSIGRFEHKWIEFLNRQVNSDVKVLDIQVDDITKAHFLSIAEKLRHLERAEFVCPLSFTADDINDFLDKCHTLDDIILKIPMELSERERLTEILPVKLNVKYYTHVDKTVIVEIKRGDNRACNPGQLDGECVADLIEKSMIDRECLNAARKSFQAYETYSFVLSGPLTSNEESTIEEYQEHEVIFVKNIDAIQMLLSNFGSFIHTITIDFHYFEAELGKQIVETMNNKCYKSLSMINLKNVKSNVLEGLKTEFVNLSRLEFSSSATETFNVSPDKLRRSFSKLEKLFLQSLKASDLTFFIDNFPNMTQLEIEFPTVGDAVDETQFGHFLKCNQQLNTLDVYHSDLRLLHKINENVPQLKHLILRKLSDNFSNDEPIHFCKLPSFSLCNDHIDDMLNKISFYQLESLALIILPNAFNDKWLKFLTHQVNTNVRNFVLEARDIGNEHFLAIAKKFPDLRSFSLACASEFTANLIFDFIESSKHLTNLKIEIQINAAEQKRLANHLPERWELINQEQIETRTRITLQM